MGNRIKTYFQSIGEVIDARYKMAGTAKHKPSIGTNREIIINEFLSKHLPKRLSSSLGGQIIDREGKESSQIDVIISNDIGVRFEVNDITFITAESVAGAISIKSKLNKTTLISALDNLRTIPTPHQATMSLSDRDYDHFLNYHPSLYVFAFDGIQPMKCLSYVIKYYKANPVKHLYQYPKGIIVNGKYIIRYQYETKTHNGETLLGETFHVHTSVKDNWGYPFYHILNDTAKYVSFLDSIAIVHHHYFNYAIET